MSNLPEISVIALLSTLTIVFTLLYLRELTLRKKMAKDGERILEEYKDKGFDLLHNSIKKSQDLLGSSELEGVKVIAQAEYSARKMEDEYSKKLLQIIQSSQSTITAAQAGLINFMADLQNRGSEFETTSRQILEQRIDQTFEKMENRLSDFLIQTEQKTTSSIELELKGARQLVENYKQQQLSLIDENIIAMMEQTLSIVLDKKLSLKDQLDFVFEALEKAKVEKFIV